MNLFSTKTIVGTIAAIALTSGCSENQGSGTGSGSGSGSTQNQNFASSWTISTKGDLNGFFECLESANRTLVSAHRAGGNSQLPENALETAQKIASQIPALYEIDVATSRDGVLFLMHDDTLDRTTNGSGKTNDLNWNEIRTLNLKTNSGRETEYHPPLLEDFLAWSKGRAIVQVDFKRTTKYEDVTALVKRMGLEKEVIYIAYSMAQARKLHRLSPSSMISVSIESQSELNSAIAAGIPAERLIGFTGTEEARPRLFSLLNGRDIEVIFGTLGGRRSIDKAIAANRSDIDYDDLASSGVDIIATDRPIAAHQTLEGDNLAVQSGECGITR